MQSDNSIESLMALKHLGGIEECLFELSFDEPRLCPVVFGSQYNLPYEEYYQSFVVEFTCDHWIIAHNCRCL